MAARNNPILKTYRRMRALEESLFETLGDALPDEAADAIAARIGLAERGEALYDHPDYGTILDLALYHHRALGQTIIERYFDETRPAPGSDAHAVLDAMTSTRVTLLRLGKAEPGVGLEVHDLLFGGALFLADPVLSRERPAGEVVILARLLPFDGFVMTPCTSYLDFDPALARMLAAGLAAESDAPMGERLASAEARSSLAEDLTKMALCSVESVKAALDRRFSGSRDLGGADP